jgi:phosphatidylglycerophosphate synthase
MTVGLRTDAFASFGAMLVALAAVAWAVHLSARFPIVAAIIFIVVMFAAIGGLDHTSHPFDRFGPANRITTLRAALVALVAGLVGEPPVPALAAVAAGTALVAMMLDGLDGRLARQSGMSSAFGARFDLEVDALLIMALAVLAWIYGKAGAWILMAGLMRYFFIGAGARWAWMRRPLPPSRRRQTICVVQIIGLIVTVAPFVRPPLSAIVAGLSLAALAYSFVVDTLWLWRKP